MMITTVHSLIDTVVRQLVIAQCMNINLLAYWLIQRPVNDGLRALENKLELKGGSFYRARGSTIILPCHVPQRQHCTVLHTLNHYQQSTAMHTLHMLTWNRNDHDKYTDIPQYVLRVNNMHSDHYYHKWIIKQAEWISTICMVSAMQQKDG